jgi:hypothetical protein
MGEKIIKPRAAGRKRRKKFGASKGDEMIKMEIVRLLLDD